MDIDKKIDPSLKMPHLTLSSSGRVTVKVRTEEEFAHFYPLIDKAVRETGVPNVTLRGRLRQHADVLIVQLQGVQRKTQPRERRTIMTPEGAR